MNTRAPESLRLPLAKVSLLTTTWWFVCPVFAVVVLRLLAERACGDPYNLLPAVAANPRWAWPLAVVYVAGHVWMLAVYLITSDSAGTLVPGYEAVQAVWGWHMIKVVLMTALMLLEYSPVGVWRLIGAWIGCR